MLRGFARERRWCSTDRTRSAGACEFELPIRRCAVQPAMVHLLHLRQQAWRGRLINCPATVIAFGTLSRHSSAYTTT